MDILTRVASGICAVFLLLVAQTALAQATEDDLRLSEQEIKAGLLYNFLKYTQWPSDTGTTIRLCIYGPDPFRGKLDPMQGRSVNRREIIVRKINRADEASGCHLLFINAQEKGRWPELRNSLNGKGILTVSDFSSFVATGGMIEFGYRDNHIAATLNIDAVHSAGLRVEDRLLRLVTVVHSGTGAE
jgi:hypothetical protein